MIRVRKQVFFLLLYFLPAYAVFADDESILSEIVVTAQRREQAKVMVDSNIQRLTNTTINGVQHQHAHELLNRVAGVWVVRGSGQEHQTSIRSPVLTGGGSCGGFLILEDGIPTRPAGFCNVNQLMETNTEQANAIEVIRGPGNALYGSNALHGIINVLMPEPGANRLPYVAVELGANSFFRVRAALPFELERKWLVSALYADDGGFRDDSGYRQGKIHIKHRNTVFDGDLTIGFTATDLQQDTAGFIYGKDAYKDPQINRSNPNPEAFRDASSVRVYGIWTRSMTKYDVDIRPYLRYSTMRFMHHALPGKPIEDNGQHSAGVMSAFTFQSTTQQTVLGLDLELADVYLEQTQAGPAQGPAIIRETRPAGKHYDYEVMTSGIAAYLQTEYQISRRLTLGGGLRLEYIHYNYENRMLAGNTRDDGSECGFGGCLYSRPEDRTDSFTNLAPKLSLGFQHSTHTRYFITAGSGFRVPQTLELYRLQNGQQISDLDSERIDALEAGVHLLDQNWSADISVYSMRKRDSAFRDAEGFNVSGARSRHIGIETAIDWQIATAWRLSVDASYARHTYDFDFDGGRGEVFISGLDIDTAPRWLASAEVFYLPTSKLSASLQWTTIGEYFLETQNLFRYPGHSLLNLRMGLRLTPQLGINLRLNNITDRAVADRADFAARRYRYLPGRGRELFVEFRYSP